MNNPFNKTFLWILVCYPSMLLGQQTAALDSLIRLLEHAKEDTNKVALLDMIALEYTYTSEPEMGTEYSTQALRLSKKLNYPYGEARSLDVMGIFHYDAGQLDSALWYYLKSLDIMQEIKDEIGECELYDKIGQIYVSIKDFDRAFAFYKKGLELSEKIGDERILGNCTNGMASYYITYGQYLLSTESDSTVLVKQYEKAIPYLERAADHFNKANYFKGSALIHGNLAFVKRDLKDYPSALEYALKALDYFETNNFINYLGLSYGQISGIYIKLKDYKNALRYANKGLAVLQGGTNIYDQTEIYNYLVIIYQELGDYVSALKYSLLSNEVDKKIFNKEKEEQIAIIQGKYDTKQKEQENLLLRQESELHQETIKRQNIITGIIAGILLVVAAITFLTYRNLIEKKNFAARIEELNSSQSRWFTNIAHELRTPLTLLLGPINHLLSSDRTLQAETRNDLALASKNGNQLLKMVNEILDISRMESGNLKLKRQPTNIKDLVNQVSASFHSFAEQKNISLTVECSESLYLDIDAEKLTNILINLTSNALKFTHSEGRVKLKVAFPSSETNELQIRVSDTGEGIPQEDLPFIFDRFFQVAKPGRTDVGGSGVGLAFSLELAKLHGGNLSATSTEGVGSEFILSLPASLICDRPVSISKNMESENSLATEGEDEEDTSYTNSNGKPQVLLVEDNPDMRRYIYNLLKIDYQVIQAIDGQDALEKLNIIHPDLIISDVMMPRIDGLELAKRLKTSDKHNTTPFITLTARVDEQDRLAALRLGIDDYLLKPFNPEELQVRAGNLIKNHQQRILALREQQEESEEINEVNLINSINPDLPSHEERLIEDLRQHVLDNLEDSSYSVKTLAEHAAMSESTLHRSIKKTTGFSPGQFIREIRLQKALYFLERNQYATIAEVVQAVGFENNAHFSSLFKKRFGKSPSALS